MDFNSTNNICVHGERELTIFGEFASVCPLGIDAKSIEKRKPPEADILCLAEQGQVGFEMVELVDQDRIARPMRDQSELMGSLRDARNDLPEETVGVRFRPQSIRKRKAVAEEVVNELIRIDPAFKGEFTLTDGDTEVAIANIERRDGIADGPHFRVLVAGHFEPIPLDALGEKFRKKYQSDGPIDLLAYYDRQHAPLDEQIDDLIQFINASIAKSPFGRVWIFNRFDQRICYPKF
jgi:hypothetical protein